MDINIQRDVRLEQLPAHYGEGSQDEREIHPTEKPIGKALISVRNAHIAQQLLNDRTQPTVESPNVDPLYGIAVTDLYDDGELIYDASSARKAFSMLSNESLEQVTQEARPALELLLQETWSATKANRNRDWGLSASHDRDDQEQEAFLELYYSAIKVGQVDVLIPYYIRCMVNSATDFHRKKKREPQTRPIVNNDVYRGQNSRDFWHAAQPYDEKRAPLADRSETTRLKLTDEISAETACMADLDNQRVNDTITPERVNGLLQAISYFKPSKHRDEVHAETNRDVFSYTIFRELVDQKHIVDYFGNDIDVEDSTLRIGYLAIPPETIDAMALRTEQKLIESGITQEEASVLLVPELEIKIRNVVYKYQERGRKAVQAYLSSQGFSDESGNATTDDLLDAIEQHSQSE